MSNNRLSIPPANESVAQRILRQQAEGRDARSILLRNIDAEKTRKADEDLRRKEADEAVSNYLSSKLERTSSTAGREIFAKGNVILVKASQEVAAEILRDEKRRFPVLKVEFDGSSKRFTESTCESSRVLWRGCKFLCLSMRIMFRLYRIDASVELPVPAHGCIFPPKKHTVARTESGEALADYISHSHVSEAFDTADFVCESIKEMIPKGRVSAPAIVNACSDSGGSTGNSHFYLSHMLRPKIDPASAVQWMTRCMIHLSAIVARNSARLLMRLAGVSVVRYEKRIYSAILTVQLKRAEVSSGLTAYLNETLKTTIEPQPVDEGLDHVLETLGVKKDVRKILSSVTHKDGLVYTGAENYDAYRRSSHSLYTITLPNWSRWLSMGGGLRGFLQGLVYGLRGYLKRMFGDKIKLREEEVTNPARVSDEEHETLVVLSYFVSLLIQPLDSYQRNHMNKRKERRTRADSVKQFAADHSQLLSKLRDLPKIFSDVQKILCVEELGDESRKRVVRMAQHTVVAAHAARVEFEYRFSGIYRDRHELWLERYMQGLESRETLLAESWATDSSGDAGAVALESLKQHILTVEGEDCQRKRLSELVDNIALLDRSTKNCEELIGRIKRNSRCGRAVRSFPSAESITRQSDYVDWASKAQRDSAFQIVVEECKRKYLYRRACDIARSDRLKNHQPGGSVIISSPHNEWKSPEEKQKYHIEALMDAYRSSEQKTGDSQSSGKTPVSGAIKNGDGDGDEDVVEMHKELAERRRPEVITIEKEMAKSIRTKMVSEFFEGKHNSAYPKMLSQKVRRWEQPLSNRPFSVTVCGRNPTDVERTVCGYVRVNNKSGKCDDESILEKKAETVDDPQAMFIEKEEEDLPPDEEDAETGEALVSSICILHLKSTKLSQGGDNVVADAWVSDWLVLRTDLQNVCFSAIALTPLENDSPDSVVDARSGRKMVIGDGILHSVAYDLLGRPNLEYELFEAEVAVHGASDPHIKRGRAITIMKGKTNANKTSSNKTLKAEVKVETVAERLVRQMEVRQSRARIQKLDRVRRPDNKTRSSSSSTASAKSSGTASQNGEAKRSSTAENSDSNSNGAKRPKASGTPIVRRVFTLEAQEAQSLSRKAVDKLLRQEFFVNRFVMKDASSRTTFKQHGLNTDRIEIKPESNLWGKKMLTAITHTLDMQCQAKTNAHKYVKHSHRNGANLSQGCSASSIWALRARFIIYRLDAYLEGRETGNRGADAMRTEYEEYLKDVPWDVMSAYDGIDPSVVGLKRFKTIDDKTLSLLTPIDLLPGRIQEMIEEDKNLDFTMPGEDE